MRTVIVNDPVRASNCVWRTLTWVLAVSQLLPAVAVPVDVRLSRPAATLRSIRLAWYSLPSLLGWTHVKPVPSPCLSVRPLRMPSNSRTNGSDCTSDASPAIRRRSSSVSTTACAARARGSSAAPAKSVWRPVAAAATPRPLRLDNDFNISLTAFLRVNGTTGVRDGTRCAAAGYDAYTVYSAGPRTGCGAWPHKKPLRGARSERL